MLLKLLRGAAHWFKALRLLLNGMSKLCQIKWTEELTFHVELLREKLKSAPPLAIVDRNIQCQAFSIFADSSSLAIGALLCQNIPVEQETKTSSIALEKPCPGKKNSIGEDTFLKPIAYFSQALSKADQRMDIASLELYATVRSLENWSHYLRGTECQIYVDNSVIYHLLKSSLDPNGNIVDKRITRLLSLLQVMKVDYLSLIHI